MNKARDSRKRERNGRFTTSDGELHINFAVPQTLLG